MNEQEKREKVIEALEACVLKDPDDSRDCRHCPRCNYGAFITNSCINGVMADALTLLKAQEPRVMTLEEVIALPDESDVWLEEFCCITVAATISHNPIIAQFLNNVSGETYFYGIKQADYNNGNYMNADYGKEWRCWSSRPTDEQMEATPWQE